MKDLALNFKAEAVSQLSGIIGDKNTEYMSRRIVTPDYNVWYAMSRYSQFRRLGQFKCDRTPMFCFKRWIPTAQNTPNTPSRKKIILCLQFKSCHENWLRELYQLYSEIC